MEGMPGMGAVGWGHYRMGGGWKALVMIGVGYMVLVGGAAAMTLQIQPADWRNIAKAWTYGCLGLAGADAAAGGAVPGVVVGDAGWDDGDAGVAPADAVAAVAGDSGISDGRGFADLGHGAGEPGAAIAVRVGRTT